MAAHHPDIPAGHGHKNEIPSLEPLEQQRGQIPWEGIWQWLEEECPPDIARAIAKVLTNDEEGEVDSEDPSTRAFLYYIYSLHRTGQLGAVFGKIYETHFSQPPVKNPVAIPTVESIIDDLAEAKMANIASAIKRLQTAVQQYGILLPENNVIKILKDLLDGMKDHRNELEKAQEQHDAAEKRLHTLLDTAKTVGMTADINRQIERARQEYDVAFANLQRFRTSYRPFVEEMTNLPNNEGFISHLHALHQQLEERKKRSEKNIVTPVPGPVVAYLCMEQEFTDAHGEHVHDAKRKIAGSLTKLVVGVTSVDLGGTKTKHRGHDEGDSIIAAYRRDLRNAGVKLTNPGDMIWRKSVEGVLKKFHFLEGLQVTSSKKDIAHHFPPDFPIPTLVELIVYLRHAAEKIEFGDREALGIFVRNLEDIVAERLACAISDGDPAEPWKRIMGILRPQFYEPMGKTDHHEIEHDLHESRVPKKEAKDDDGHGEHGGKGKKSLLERLGPLGSAISGANAVRQILGGKKGGGHLPGARH